MGLAQNGEGFFLVFRDPEKAALVIERLSAQAHRDVEPIVRAMFDFAPAADAGLARLERFLKAFGSQGSMFAQFESVPVLAKLLGTLLSTSQHMGDLLVQNPELSTLVVDPSELLAVHTVDDILGEGRRLVALSSSYAHRLDRLRFLRQMHLVRLAAVDLGDLAEQEEIWGGLSDLAEALILLTRDVAWDHFRKNAADLPEVCPLFAIGMGKFGGRELNYSSDIDLVFGMPDSVNEQIEDRCMKFAEVWRAALADRMGRGDLYRVDLRLRPFGSQGPIVSRMKVLERYYTDYSEPWEHLAMVRSKMIGADEESCSRWDALRNACVYTGARSEAVVASLLKMRARSEQIGSPDDLKRGSGGIRDIEFLVQINQMLQGKAHVELKGLGTVPAIRQLTDLELIEDRVGRELSESYQYLRKVEHRCQIVGNIQTHELPSDPDARTAVAWSLGAKTSHALESSLDVTRAGVRAIYDSVFNPVSEVETERDPTLLYWLKGLPGEDKFLRSLDENLSSLARVTKIVHEAPALLPMLRQSVSVTEQVLSGEIDDQRDPRSRFGGAGGGNAESGMTRAMRNGWARAAVRKLLIEDLDGGAELSAHLDACVWALSEAWGDGYSVVALGSLAAEEMTPTSDADVIVFIDESVDRAEAERQLQKTLQEIKRYRGLGIPLSVDMRLRPEGRVGRLAVTYPAFERYQAEFMETWERFALGRSRLILGCDRAAELAGKAAYDRPITREELDELVAMKARIESERLNPRTRLRHVKLGFGGIDDITWLCQLWLLRDHSLFNGTPPVRTADRLALLTAGGVFTAVEHDILSSAHSFLTELRWRLYLKGISDDIMPENPDRLARLADAFGLSDPNEILALFERHTHRVRAIFDENLSRLLS